MQPAKEIAGKFLTIAKLSTENILKYILEITKRLIPLQPAKGEAKILKGKGKRPSKYFKIYFGNNKKVSTFAVPKQGDKN
ncbi:MAG: hypothetical protein ACXVJC_11550 [Mucilaginibacter sp.]